MMENVQKGLSKMVKNFRDVALDGDEKAFLSLGPHFTMFEDFTKAKTETDFLTALQKWDGVEWVNLMNR